MKTNPQPRTIDHLPSCAVATEQTLVALMETKPGFAALIAAHVSCEPDDGSIQLEECSYLRITPEGGRSLRHYPMVTVMRDACSGHWIASPDGLVSVFAQPSRDPYAIIHLSERTSKALDSALDQGDYDAAFMMIRVRFAELPRFYAPAPRRILSVATYASGGQALKGRFSIID